MEGLERFADLAKDIKPTDEMISFAKKLYPQISVDTVDKNYNEIAYAMLFDQACAGCFGLQHCPGGTKGLHPVAAEMRPDGHIEWAFTNCKYLGDWRYNRRNNATTNKAD